MSRWHVAAWCLALVVTTSHSAWAAKPAPVLGGVPCRCAVKRSHYYKTPDWPGKGYGWAGHSAEKWWGYGPLGTGAYRGYGFGYFGYPAPFRAYKFGYPENTLGPGNVGNGYITYTYFGEGYPGWKFWPGRYGQHW